MTPPLLLTVATFIWAGMSSSLFRVRDFAFICAAGIAGHHFLSHGVQFYGKRGSISSLTGNLYLRLVGMALLETLFSAVLITVVMWGVLSPGLSPIGSMSRNLSKVRIWGPEVITTTVRTGLEIEWSVTVVQSVVFFGLFACRMEVAREGWELICSFLRRLKRSSSSAALEQGTSEKSSTRCAELLIGAYLF